MVPQLSVFLQNKSGKIAAITRALQYAGVDIRALSIADTTDFGILRMLVNNIDAAKKALSDQNCIVKVNDVVIVAVPDVPGGLAGVLELMAAEKIDIEYMYSLFNRGKKDAYMVFRVSDEARLLSLLRKHSVRTITGDEIGCNR